MTKTFRTDKDITNADADGIQQPAVEKNDGSRQPAPRPVPDDRDDRYRILFESSRDGILLVSAETGDVLDLSNSFFSLAGLVLQPLEGKKIWEIDAFRQTDAIMVMFKELQQGEYIRYDSLPLLRPDGTTISVEITGTSHETGGRKFFQVRIRDISRRKAIEDKLWKAESRFRALFENAAFGIAMVAPAGSVIETNAAFGEMLGYSVKEIAGKTFTELIFPEDRESDDNWFQELLALKRDNYQLAVRFVRKDGPLVWGLLAVSLVLGNKRQPQYAIRMIEDITERKRAEEIVLKSRNFYLSLIDELPNPIRRSDADGQSDYFNRAWLEYRGSTISQEIGDEWIRAIHPDDRFRFMTMRAAALKTRSPYVTEYRLQNRKGVYRWMVESSRPFNDLEGVFGGYISSCYDVQDRKSVEEMLHSLSTTDELTGLLNRRGFFSLAKQQIKVANRTRKGFLLVYVDLDGMKRINDMLGHPEGDLALVETASVLKAVSRQSDIIGRLGGDEFAILALEQQAGRDQEQAILTRIQDHIADKNALPGRRYRLSISVGIAAYDPGNPCSLDDLITRADALMYAEKNSKRID